LSLPRGAKRLNPSRGGLRSPARSADELRYQASKYGIVKDVYLPKDHYTG
jgi:hypothetical protein